MLIGTMALTGCSSQYQDWEKVGQELPYVCEWRRNADGDAQVRIQPTEIPENYQWIIDTYESEIISVAEKTTDSASLCYEIQGLHSGVTVVEVSCLKTTYAYIDEDVADEEETPYYTYDENDSLVKLRIHVEIDEKKQVSVTNVECIEQVQISNGTTECPYTMHALIEGGVRLRMAVDGNYDWKAEEWNAEEIELQGPFFEKEYVEFEFHPVKSGETLIVLSSAKAGKRIRLTILTDENLVVSEKQNEVETFEPIVEESADGDSSYIIPE
jgi:hypothetical protein